MITLNLKKRELPYAFIEEIKQLRTNIEYSGSDNKVIMFTSAAEDEGKSTLTLEVSRSFAELGKTVLLIDADMRKSEFHTRIADNCQKPRGLSYFLSGQTEFDNVLCHIEEIPKLYCIFSGRVPPNPSELLANKRMTKLVAWARDNFDYVFIDCPPMNVVVDASVIASYVDASILVVKSGGVSRRIVQNVIKQLERIECPLIGVVLNKFNANRHGYGYYAKRGYGGYYGHKKPVNS